MPRLLIEAQSADRTARAFETQWRQQRRGAFEKDTIYGETAKEELQSCLDRFEIEAASQLESLRILDIGCGSGRLTRNLALYAPGALVVGGDRSAAATVAHERCRELPNVVIAQMDLHTPPFPSESFDFVYADGVLPHVPEPQVALESLHRLLRPGGKLFVWIYPRRFSPYRLVRDILMRPYKLPRALQWLLCWGLGLPLFVAFKFWEGFHGPRRRTLREVVFMLHDNLTPEFQHRYAPEEMAALFIRLGFVDVKLLDPPVGVVGRRRGAAGSSKEPCEEP
jgi:SAM-dependent methyltransferase